MRRGATVLLVSAILLAGCGGATRTVTVSRTTAPEPAKSIGVVAILSEGSTYAFYLAAEHLPPSHGFFYAVWLYNSPTSYEALSKSPPVGSDGRLQGGSLLPSNAGSYHQMILTRETSKRPRQPGQIVLGGPFKLGHPRRPEANRKAVETQRLVLNPVGE